jgi:sensor domain CHASE-containing protein
MSQVVLGIQALLWAPGYNVFADLGTLPVLLSVYALCAVLERACRSGGKAFGLWAIDESVARLEQQGQGGDLRGLLRQLEAPAKFRAAELASGAPTRVKFHASQWRVVQQARAEEDALKFELASDRVAAQTFRDMFLQYNKPWLQGQLHEVFTPRTLFLYRREIIG